MQGITASLLIFCIPTLAFAGNHWSVMLPGGNMRFQGQVIAESCRVEAENQQLIVNMGKISSNRFHHIGEDINPVSFDIRLEECNLIGSKRLGITFRGVSDEKNQGVLSVGEEAGRATGLGIALFNKDGTQIRLNSLPETWISLDNGLRTLHFVAKYRSVARQVTGGTTNALAWFSFTYQ